MSDVLIEKYLIQEKTYIDDAIKNIISTGQKEKNTKAEIVNKVARFLSHKEKITMQKATQKALTII